MTSMTETQEFDPLDLPPAERWEPWKVNAHPEVIRGVVVAKYTKYSDYTSTDKNFVDVLVEDRVWTLSGFTTRVHDELAKANPTLGDKIGVKFLGMKERRTDKKEYPDVLIANYSRPLASAAVDFAPAEGAAPDVNSDAPALTPSGPTDLAPEEEVNTGDIPF